MKRGSAAAAPPAAQEREELERESRNAQADTLNVNKRRDITHTSLQQFTSWFHTTTHKSSINEQSASGKKAGKFVSTLECQEEKH